MTTYYLALAELAKAAKEHANLPYYSIHEADFQIAVTPDVVLALIAERDLYHEALWKACGDDEVHVNAYLEAVKP